MSRFFHYRYELTRPALPQLALLIIAKCGFGFSFNWLEPPRSADGKMTIEQALRTVSHNLMAFLLIPKQFQRLPFSGYVTTDLLTCFL